ncbi:MAG: DsbA family protein [Chloroflexi bacterium]|nr:DsbA family protein [Chloroflexota bacterium]
MDSSSGARMPVEFYTDPLCPWAWRTAVWIRDVAKVRPITIKWGLLALEEINRSEAGTEYHKRRTRARPVLRTLTLALREGGDEMFDRLYVELGKARHEESEDLGERATLDNAVKAAGLAADLPDRALADSATDDFLRTEYDRLADLGAFGVPTIIIPDAKPMFGPIIYPRDDAEDAGELWDHFVWLTRRGDFYELKRNRD